MTVGKPYNPYQAFTSACVPNWLMRRTNKEISQGAKLAFARLAQYAGRDGKCVPKIGTLAVELGVTDRQAAAYLDQLEKKGLIRATRKGHHCNYEFLEHPWMDEGSNQADVKNTSYRNDADVQEASDQIGSKVHIRNEESFTSDAQKASDQMGSILHIPCEENQGSESRSESSKAATAPNEEASSDPLKALFPEEFLAKALFKYFGRPCCGDEHSDLAHAIREWCSMGWTVTPEIVTACVERGRDAARHRTGRWPTKSLIWLMTELRDAVVPETPLGPPPVRSRDAEPPLPQDEAERRERNRRAQEQRHQEYQAKLAANRAAGGTAAMLARIREEMAQRHAVPEVN